jgi:hypothetical protein
MTPVTALSHCPPGGESRFRRRIAVASAPPESGAMPPIMPKSPRRQQQRRQTPYRDSRSAADDSGRRVPYASRRPTKFP